MNNNKIVIALNIIAILLLCYQFSACDQKTIIYQARVEKIIGNQFILSNGSRVGLIGVDIPLSNNPNYSQLIAQNMIKLLLNERIKVKVILKKHPSSYPQVDLVEVYTLNGQNINRKLLSTGMAFFREDYWDPEQKMLYRELETQARKSEKGIWQNTDNLKPLYVRKKGWKNAYSPFCREVQDLKQEDKIIYYTPLPEVSHRGILVKTLCDINNDIAK